MMTLPSNASESRVVRRDGVDYASSVISRREAGGHVDLPKSGISLQPTVRISPVEAVKRLGTGSQPWFSESVYVSINKKVEFRFQGRVHLLVLYNEGARKNGETSIGDLQTSCLRNLTHKLTFVPAGCVYREWYETGTTVRMTFLYLDPSTFRNSDDVENCRHPRIHFEDASVWDTASKLKNVIEGGRAGCAPYLEALSGVLGHELSRVDREILGESGVSRGGLAGWQERAVVRYIEEHLGEQFSLLKLSEIAQLSLHHFCRAFKQSFGMPAHRYQVCRRMEVAKGLLADRTTSVTEIALSLGYAQTSSFSSAFRKTTGWTPTAYRRQFKYVSTVHGNF
jgi:AraC family transcriptional regulator